MQKDQIGKGIANRRKQLGLSQEEVARLLGVTRQAVSRWESGTALPSVDNMIELSKALHVGVDELLLLKSSPQDTGLSAQSVGLLLDEFTARQDKRIKRLMLAMSIAAVILVVGIVVSTGVGLLHANQMEEQLNDRITSTNVHLTSSMENMNARISNTIQQAISDGDTRLADSGYRVEYDHETRSFVVDLYAHPKTLGTFQDAEFTFVQWDGNRLSTEAQLVNGRFEGTIIIPDLGQECISGDVYLTWLEDEKTIAELIQFYDRWTYFDRLMITSAWMDTQQRQDSVVSVKPWASVRLCFDAPDTYPVSIRYDIYSGGERIATVTEAWPVQQLRTSADFNAGTITHTLSEYVRLKGVAAADQLMLRVTVTDAAGRTFSYDAVPEKE